MRSFVLFAALVLVLAGAWWLTRSPRVPSEAIAAEDGRAADERTPLAPELARAEAPAAATTDTARSALSDEAPRALLHGHFVALDGVTPLAAELTLLVATSGNRVAESLRSKSDGSFASTRRFPAGTLKAWVTDPRSGDLLAKHEALFDPAAGDWLVPLELPAHAAPVVTSDPDGTSLRGTVVDLEGHAVVGAVVRLLPRERAPTRSDKGDESLQDATDDDGVFHFGPLEPGDYRLLAFARFAHAEPLVVEVHAGLNLVDALVLPVGAGAGVIRGKLVLEDGSDEDPYAILVLRDLAGGKELGCASSFELNLFGNSPPDGETDFAIEGIPAGRYALSVVSVDGRVYEPASLLVSPPADGIEFRSGTRPRAVGLRVRAAQSGDELESFTTLGRIHGQWVGGRGKSGEELFSPAYDRWLAWAPGFRVARGDFSGARPDTPVGSHELALVDVTLQPGWGDSLLFRDAEGDAVLVQGDDDGTIGAALGGVRVLADGALAGTSDGDGLAVLELARAPARIDYELDGWSVVCERVDDDVRVVWMARR